MEAVNSLPPEGALILLIDYGDGPSFPPRPMNLAMGEGKFAEFECCGASTAFYFRVGGRDLQARIALGSRADDVIRDRALATLAGLTADESR